jgi:hypothetical protein
MRRQNSYLYPLPSFFHSYSLIMRESKNDIENLDNSGIVDGVFMNEE